MLVDQLGFKDRSRGGAVVSGVHGNFILNAGGAKARDVLDLIAGIKQSALQGSDFGANQALAWLSAQNVLSPPVLQARRGNSMSRAVT